MVFFLTLPNSSIPSRETLINNEDLVTREVDRLVIPGGDVRNPCGNFATLNAFEGDLEEENADVFQPEEMTSMLPPTTTASIGGGVNVNITRSNGVYEVGLGDNNK